MPTRPLAAKGIATTRAAPSTAASAAARKGPRGVRSRARMASAASSATPLATAAVVPWPGSFTAIPQITRRAEIPAAGPGAALRARPESTISAAPSRSEAAAISAPASRAESIGAD